MTKKSKTEKIKIKDEAENPVEETVMPAEEEQEEIVTLSKADYDALNAALEEAKKKEQENLESWQRERADFSNYKKRIERDQDDAKRRYKADVLAKFLPVLDDLELAYQHKPEESEAASWAEGIELIIRKFRSVLENGGLEQIEVKAGDNMVPNLHMAVSSEDSDEFGSDEIIEVLQNGYRTGDKVIRPAMVRVAR